MALWDLVAQGLLQEVEVALLPTLPLHPIRFRLESLVDVGFLRLLLSLAAHGAHVCVSLSVLVILNLVQRCGLQLLAADGCSPRFHIKTTFLFYRLLLLEFKP